MTDTPSDKMPEHGEWSVPFNPDHVKDLGNHLNISANDQERKDLARRFDLVELPTLSASIKIEKAKGTSGLHVTGTLTADITQLCVISDEAVTTHVEEKFEAWFADPDKIVSLQKARRDKAIKEGRELQIMEEEEDPEPYINGMIDLGELAAQNLSLVIPPYPRAEGIEFDGMSTKMTEEQEKAFENPFAALADWKKDNSAE